MVKRQKEKQYNSSREQKAYSKLRSGDPSAAGSGGGRRRPLPFACCALTLTPFQDPVCTKEGILFDNAALTQFVLQHQKDPVTGSPMATRDIIQLHMAASGDDDGGQGGSSKWQCPILNKVFDDHLKIVAIRDRSLKNPNENFAYVYSYEAYHELNVKAKSYLDLTTGHPFDPKKDVIILNDPDNEAFQQQRDISRFWHIQSQHKKLLELDSKAEQNSNVRHSVTASRIMQQIQKEKKEKSKGDGTSHDANSSRGKNSRLQIFAQDVTGVQYTSGKASTSFTSTSMDVTRDNAERLATEEEILQHQFQYMKALGKRNKKLGKNAKGYVKLITNRGVLLLELHCDIVPRTCTNFLGLCQEGAYDNTIFHRLIPKFMIQGGKKKKMPKQQTGVKIEKDEDSSWWGPSFVDEFDDRLTHTGKGILSMANAGPNTNKRQFFITFDSCPHLNRKHSIFGKVVEGMDVLQSIELVGSDAKNRPLEEIYIEKTEIVVNPAQEAREWQEKQVQQCAAEREQRKEQQSQQVSALLGKKTTSSVSGGNSESVRSMSSNEATGVGRYLPQSAKRSIFQLNDDTGTTDVGGLSSKVDSEGDKRRKKPLSIPPIKKVKKAPPTKTTYGDFSGW